MCLPGFLWAYQRSHFEPLRVLLYTGNCEFTWEVFLSHQKVNMNLDMTELKGVFFRKVQLCLRDFTIDLPSEHEESKDRVWVYLMVIVFVRRQWSSGWFNLRGCILPLGILIWCWFRGRWWCLNRINLSNQLKNPLNHNECWLLRRGVKECVCVLHAPCWRASNRCCIMEQEMYIRWYLFAWFWL